MIQLNKRAYKKADYHKGKVIACFDGIEEKCEWDFELLRQMNGTVVDDILLHPSDVAIMGEANARSLRNTILECLKKDRVNWIEMEN
jgi:hypothetical protein